MRVGVPGTQTFRCRRVAVAECAEAAMGESRRKMEGRARRRSR